MKVLVTGGAGFIGSHLCRRLLEEGHRVTCVDNLDDYYDPAIKARRLEELEERSGFAFLKGDLLDVDFLEKKVFDGEYETVVHLAARPGVRASFMEPERYFRNNIMGILNLLECCRKRSVGKVLFGSSSSVYGSTEDIPFSERSRLRPISPYGISKAAGEMVCSMYNELFHIPIVALRFFTVYGPGQRPDMGIHQFTRRIYRGEKVIVYGEGDTARDYTHVRDILDGIISAMELEGEYEVINLGDSRPIRLDYLLSLIEENLGVKARIERLPEQPGDPRMTHADISKAEALLGYRPRIPIEEGIRDFVQWFVKEGKDLDAG